MIDTKPLQNIISYCSSAAKESLQERLWIDY